MEKKHNIDNDKRIVLPFAKYEVSYNPSDALTLSILKGNKNKFEIFNCCWEVFAFQFCQNGYQYFDAHLWHNTQSIKREFVKRVLLEEDISLNFENALKEGKYIFVVLDRTKIHGFNDKKFFPHLVYQKKYLWLLILVKTWDINYTLFLTVNWKGLTNLLMNI